MMTNNYSRFEGTRLYKLEPKVKLYKIVKCEKCGYPGSGQYCTRCGSYLMTTREYSGFTEKIDTKEIVKNNKFKEKIIDFFTYEEEV